MKYLEGIDFTEFYKPQPIQPPPLPTVGVDVSLDCFRRFLGFKFEIPAYKPSCKHYMHNTHTLTYRAFQLKFIFN